MVELADVWMTSRLTPAARLSPLRSASSEPRQQWIAPKDRMTPRAFALGVLSESRNERLLEHHQVRAQVRIPAQADDVVPQGGGQVEHGAV
jgi:hypothetical protein